MKFSIVKGRAKSIVLTSSLSPGGGVYSRALKTEKSQSPPFPVGGGAVVTNDWCINYLNKDIKQTSTNYVLCKKNTFSYFVVYHRTISLVTVLHIIIFTSQKSAI